MTDRHRQLRLTWCQERACWNQEWIMSFSKSQAKTWRKRQLQFCVERETALTRALWFGVP
nr:unnamed protein product [Callosobruchus chinensis]